MSLTQQELLGSKLFLAVGQALHPLLVPSGTATSGLSPGRSALLSECEEPGPTRLITRAGLARAESRLETSGLTLSIGLTRGLYMC